MKFHREEYLELMTFGRVERQMFVELFGLMVGVGEAWAGQGATEEEAGLSGFDWDWVPYVSCGGNAHVRGGWRETVIEETDEFVVKRDPLGRRLKLYKNVSSIPLPLDYPVRTMDDWLELKPLFEYDEGRIDGEAVERARRERDAGAVVVAWLPGGFDIPRQLMGAENACLSYYDQPELMQDILRTLTDTACRLFERLADEVVIDQLCVHEDLAGKAGPLIGPAQFEQYVKPYYRVVWDILSSAGTRLFDVDTDGNVLPLIDHMLEAGVTTLLPVEPAAGMDAVALRKKYGRRLALKGGINKYVLREDRGAIRRELEYKMQPLMREGGTVFGLDHRVPDGTSLENYRYYVDLGREILGLPPRDGGSKGWNRMAF